MGLLYLLSPLFSVFELQHEKDMHWVSHTENPIHAKTRIAICRWRAERFQKSVAHNSVHCWLKVEEFRSFETPVVNAYVVSAYAMRMHKATTNSHHHLPSLRNSRLAKLESARQLPILTLSCASLSALSSHQCSVDNRLHCASSIATMITLTLLLDHFVQAFPSHLSLSC
jgi:hypothetical protein